MKKLLYILIAFFSWNTAQAQELVSVESLGSLTALDITTQIFFFLAQAENGVDMYKVTYTTLDAKNQLDTASGFMSIPNGIDAAMPWVAYQHGTTDGPTNVPSNLEADYIAAVAYSAFGYISTTADYIGMGESRGFHPYVHDATQARAGIDMAYAVRDYINDEPILDWDNRFFVSGYSQGGHAAMGMLRELEANHTDEFPVTAATPMSGPYSVSGVMVDLINQEEPYGTAAYIPYVVLGYQEVYEDLYTDLNEVFKPAYADMIAQFGNREIGLEALNTFLVSTLVANEGASIPKRMFQDAYYNDFLNNPDNILLEHLRENDNYNWTSNTPMEIYYCTEDEQVPFRNALVADSTMNAMGSADVSSRSVGAFMHGQCAAFALIQSKDFFNGFMLSSAQYVENIVGVRVGPNPTSNYVNIISENSNIDQLVLIDAQGKLLYQNNNTNWSEKIIDVSNYSTGMYYLQIISGHKSTVQKIVVGR